MYINIPNSNTIITLLTALNIGLIAATSLRKMVNMKSIPEKRIEPVAFLMTLDIILLLIALSLATKSIGGLLP